MAKSAIKMVGPETQKRVSHCGLEFSKETETKIKNILKRYPKEQSQSALIPVLKLAQDEFGGWLSTSAMQLAAERLNLPYIRVYEVATFYTMFNLDPVGKYHVQVCTNCSCMIRGSDAIVEAVKEYTALKGEGGVSDDSLFTLTEVECLGACTEAPMMQINNHYYTKLDKAQTLQILDNLKKGHEVVDATPTKPMKDGY
ncbi:MAG: NADH-quinone oxidoreductase E subunit [Alphaproteobacteria bacterium]|jgi:NADH-quinone oxidoreductase E subunit